MTQLADRSRWQGSAEAVLAAYCRQAGSGDIMCGTSTRHAGLWPAILEEVLAAGAGSIAQVQEQLQSHVREIGTSFRLPNEGEERQWPVSPVPLAISEAEWAALASAAISINFIVPDCDVL